MKKFNDFQLPYRLGAITSRKKLDAEWRTIARWVGELAAYGIVRILNATKAVILLGNGETGSDMASVILTF